MCIKHLKKYILHLFFILSFISCDTSAETNDQKIDINFKNFPVIDGSDSTEPLRNILACKLLGLNYSWIRRDYLDGLKVVVIDPNSCQFEDLQHLNNDCLRNSNTHNSFINLIEDKVELIISARIISRDEQKYAEEKGVALIEKSIGIDALTFIVNPKNPVKMLTIQQIQNIYSGIINNWKEVEGEDMAIVPFIRNANSGSEEKFETMVMKDIPIAAFDELYIGNSMLSPYYQIRENIGGLAFTPFYYYNVMVDNGTTSAIGINGVEMTATNIKNGNYLLISHIYTAVRSDIDKSSIAWQIFDYLTSNKGQETIKESGYIPL